MACLFGGGESFAGESEYGDNQAFRKNVNSKKKKKKKKHGDSHTQEEVLQ